MNQTKETALHMLLSKVSFINQNFIQMRKKHFALIELVTHRGSIEWSYDCVYGIDVWTIVTSFPEGCIPSVLDWNWRSSIEIRCNSRPVIANSGPFSDNEVVFPSLEWLGVAILVCYILPSLTTLFGSSMANFFGDCVPNHRRRFTDSFFKTNVFFNCPMSPSGCWINLTFVLWNYLNCNAQRELLCKLEAASTSIWLKSSRWRTLISSCEMFRGSIISRWCRDSRHGTWISLPSVW
jgi:hypothetical protein